MNRAEAIAELHLLCTELPGWEPAPAIATEAAYHHPGVQAWVRVTAGDRLALAGGGLLYPRSFPLKDLGSLTELRDQVLELGAGELAQTEPAT